MFSNPYPEQIVNNNPFPERQEGDINLVSEVTALLSAAGSTDPFSWQTRLGVEDPNVIGPKLQRFLVNRYWRLKMGLSPADSTMPRYCLVESGLDSEYLEIFKTNILPFIIQNNVT